MIETGKYMWYTFSWGYRKTSSNRLPEEKEYAHCPSSPAQKPLPVSRPLPSLWSCKRNNASLCPCFLYSLRFWKIDYTVHTRLCGLRGQKEPVNEKVNGTYPFHTAYAMLHPQLTQLSFPSYRNCLARSLSERKISLYTLLLIMTSLIQFDRRSLHSFSTHIALT